MTVAKTITRLNDLGVGHGKVDGPKIPPLSIIIRKNYNMRDMESERVRDHIAWLKGTILANHEAGRPALDKPLQVEWKDKAPYLVDGQCRLTAIIQLWKEGHQIYPPVNQVSGDEADVLAVSLRANGGLPPTQLEFGERAKQLVNLGWSVDRVAALAPPHLSNEKVRKMWVRQSLELQQAPVEVQELVKKGVEGVAVSSAAALHEVRADKKHKPEPGATAAERLTKQAVEAKATGKKTVKREKTEGKATKEKKFTASALEVGDDLAALCIAEHPDWDAIDKLARKYIRLRK